MPPNQNPKPKINTILLAVFWIIVGVGLYFVVKNYSQKITLENQPVAQVSNSWQGEWIMKDNENKTPITLRIDNLTEESFDYVILIDKKVSVDKGTAWTIGNTAHFAEPTGDIEENTFCEFNFSLIGNNLKVEDVDKTCSKNYGENKVTYDGLYERVN